MSETDLADIARRVMKDFPDYEVVVVFGFLLRAARRGVLTAVPVEAKTEKELRTGITRQRRMGQLAASDTERREAAQS